MPNIMPAGGGGWPGGITGMVPVGSGGGGGVNNTPLGFFLLPETKAAADSSHFVTVAANSVGGNLTGAGGGLTGANLVFTQVGTVAAASGGWTSIEANKGFTLTDTFIDTFLRNAGGCSFLLHGRNFGGLSGATQKYLTKLDGTSPVQWYAYTKATTTTFVAWQQVLAKCGATLALQMPNITEILPASGEFWVLTSFDYTNGLHFYGVALGATQPTKLSDFVVYNVAAINQDPPASAVSCVSNYVLGCNSDGASFGFASFTAKLGPSVTLV